MKWKPSKKKQDIGIDRVASGQKMISLKWIYKLKKDTNGEIVKYKVKIITKRFVEKKGIDFEEVSTPVTLLETVHLLLAL